MLHGHEVGVAIVAGNGSHAAEKEASTQIAQLEAWFDGLWAKASVWKTVRTQYEDLYRTRENFSALAPTDDDSADSATLTVGARGRAFSLDQLRQLRAADNLWIAGGTLSKNRGPSLPGNQLMMRRFTRRFFGFKAVDVPRDTHIGVISVRYSGTERNDCTIRYSNNAMDVLTLPVPGHGGPSSYDDQVLHFERITDSLYVLTVYPASAEKDFRKRSDRLGSAFHMSSGRGFGVF
jgi:hypothetical protein